METHVTSLAPLGVLEAIKERRSVRDYTGERVDRRLLLSLLHAAVRAPTALHAEPWAFAIVQSDPLLRRISDRAKALWAGRGHPAAALLPPEERFAERMRAPDFDIFHGAGTLVVICAHARAGADLAVADCWLAAGNFMLAATAFDLGSCVVGSALGALNTHEIKAELRIPGEARAVAPLVVGYPSEPTALSPRREPEILSWIAGPGHRDAGRNGTMYEPTEGPELGDGD